jgi:hypothetical protein
MQPTEQKIESLSTLGDVAELLTGESKASLTRLEIPLTFNVQGGKVDRSIVVHYRFDEQTEETIIAGTYAEPLVLPAEREKLLEAEVALDAIEEAPETADSLSIISKHPVPHWRNYTTAEQLAFIVKRIEGVERQLDVQFFFSFDKRHQAQIVKAIRADVYPNDTPSAASSAGTSTEGTPGTASRRATSRS